MYWPHPPVEGERAYYMKTQAARKQQRLHNVKKKHIRGKEKVCHITYVPRYGML